MTFTGPERFRTVAPHLLSKPDGGLIVIPLRADSTPTPDQGDVAWIVVEQADHEPLLIRRDGETGNELTWRTGEFQDHCPGGGFSIKAMDARAITDLTRQVVDSITLHGPVTSKIDVFQLFDPLFQFRFKIELEDGVIVGEVEALSVTNYNSIEPLS